MDATTMFNYQCCCGYVASARSTAAMNEMVFDHQQAASSMAVAALRAPLAPAAQHHSIREMDLSKTHPAILEKEKGQRE